MLGFLRRGFALSKQRRQPTDLKPEGGKLAGLPLTVGWVAPGAAPGVRPNRLTSESTILFGASIFLTLGIAALCAVSGHAQSVTATIDAGGLPNSIAVNSATNRIYVTSSIKQQSVTVINGSTNATTTLNYDQQSGTLYDPWGVAINSQGDSIYVTNLDLGIQIDRIDGSTNAVTHIVNNTSISLGPLGLNNGIVINPVTNRIYVLGSPPANGGNGVVAVIDGRTNTYLTAIPVGPSPWQIVLNAVTNKIYALDAYDKLITVIDGATNNYTTIDLTQNVIDPNALDNVIYPLCLAVNPVTNKIFVGGEIWTDDTTGTSTYYIGSMDGTTNAVTWLPVENTPTPSSNLATSSAENLAVDSATNRVYGDDPVNNQILAYDVGSSKATWLKADTGPSAVGVDEGTNTIYVLNSTSNDVTVVNGATNSTSLLKVGNDPTALAIDSSTHAVYVLNHEDSTVSVISGPAQPAVTTTTTLKSDTNPALPGANVTFTAYVSAASGTATPTGAVTFSIDGASGTPVALNGSGEANYSTSSLTAGSHTVIASYAGTSGFESSTSSALTQMISAPVAAAPIFSPAAGTYTSAQTVTLSDSTPGATIHYTTNNTPPTASSTVYSGPITVGSTETIQAIAAASGYSTSTLAEATYTINIPAPGFTLSASPTSLSVAQGGTGTSTITIADVGGFSGVVTLAATGLPSGVSASFANGSAADTQVLTLTASASAATTSSAATLTITGISGSLSATTTVSLGITAEPTFSPGTGGTTSMTITPGATKGNTGTISVAGTNGFTGTVALTCRVTTTMTGVSDMPTCSLNPATVTISGSTAQISTLTVTTTASSSARNENRNPFAPPFGGATLALVLLFVRPRRRNPFFVMMVLLVLIMSTGLMACGGSGSGGSGGGTSTSAGTTPGSYTVTATGTSGSISATVGTIALTVQ